MGTTISRRGFVAGAVGAAGLLAIGGAGVAVGEPAGRTLLRPPGGQDEARFVGECIRCDRCRSVCPQGIVVTASLEDGLKNVRTPRLDFRRGFCNFCDKCVEVCPTSALVPFDESREKIGAAVVDQDECIAWSSGGCRACIDACPYGAISSDGAGRPIVDEAACNGCGLCENVCPSSTYGSYTGTGKRGVNVEARS